MCDKMFSRPSLLSVCNLPIKKIIEEEEVAVKKYIITSGQCKNGSERNNCWVHTFIASQCIAFAIWDTLLALQIPKGSFNAIIAHSSPSRAMQKAGILERYEKRHWNLLQPGQSDPK